MNLCLNGVSGCNQMSPLQCLNQHSPVNAHQSPPTSVSWKEKIMKLITESLTNLKHLVMYFSVFGTLNIIESDSKCTRCAISFCFKLNLQSNVTL